MLDLMNHIILLFILVLVVLIGFYHYAKGVIFDFAPALAQKTSLVSSYPLSQVTGLVELVMVAICHIIFCFTLLVVFKIDCSIIFKINFLDCLYGALIGIGTIGLSILLCTIAMKIMEFYNVENVPKTLDGWMAIANAGWIRHHNDTVKILPLYATLIVITMQVGSEEIIFRAVLFNTFMPYGVLIAFFIATGLFIYMQTLHMPSKMSAMFPVIGATVMGVTHGLLYLHNPSIIPLVISHVTFFIFTVI